MQTNINSLNPRNRIYKLCMRSEEQIHLSQSPDNSLMVMTPRVEAEDRDRVVHYYIEQENSKGRFIPNLLLLDRLHSKVDSTNNTLLAHMCSYNSPYLNLLLDSLPDGDETINKRNNFGNSPLEIAALYSTKSIMNKLKEKGGTGDIGPDYWAIRGGNLANWSGQVPLDKKELVHWAAYNDLPEVLTEFNRLGVSMVETDQNGSSPIDIAASNKSYKAFKYLLELGQRPNPEKLKLADSLSMNKMYNQAVHPQKAPHPIIFFAFYILLQYILVPRVNMSGMLLFQFLLFIALSCSPAPRLRLDQGGRILHFQSKLLRNRIQWGNNHIVYLLFNFSSFLIGLYCLSQSDVGEYYKAFLYLTQILLTCMFGGNFLVQMIGISKNLTHSELVRRQDHPELYRKIKVVKELHLVYHEYSNPRDRGFVNNWKYYASLY